MEMKSPYYLLTLEWSFKQTADILNTQGNGSDSELLPWMSSINEVVLPVTLYARHFVIQVHFMSLMNFVVLIIETKNKFWGCELH
jgi:hypothetical protein